MTVLLDHAEASPSTGPGPVLVLSTAVVRRTRAVVRPMNGGPPGVTGRLLIDPPEDGRVHWVNSGAGQVQGHRTFGFRFLPPEGDRGRDGRLILIERQPTRSWAGRPAMFPTHLRRTA